MKSIFFFLLFCLLTIQLQAQETIQSDQFEGIELRNTDKGKTRLLAAEKKIRVFTATGEKMKGRFHVVDGETIQIDGISIRLADISSLRATRLGNKIAGGVLTGVGGIGVIGGGLIMVQSSNSNSSGAGFGILAGAILSIISAVPVTIGVPLLVMGKKYKTGKGWTYHIYSRL